MNEKRHQDYHTLIRLLPYTNTVVTFAKINTKLSLSRRGTLLCDCIFGTATYVNMHVEPETFLQDFLEILKRMKNNEKMFSRCW